MILDTTFSNTCTEKSLENGIFEFQCRFELIHSTNRTSDVKIPFLSAAEFAPSTDAGKFEFLSASVDAESCRKCTDRLVGRAVSWHESEFFSCCAQQQATSHNDQRSTVRMPVCNAVTGMQRKQPLSLVCPGRRGAPMLQLWHPECMLMLPQKTQMFTLKALKISFNTACFTPSHSIPTQSQFALFAFSLQRASSHQQEGCCHWIQS